MILPLIVIFGIGATASLVAARAFGRFWAWIAAFVNLLIFFNELSFAFRRTAEWVRIDLLLTIPIFALTILALGVFAFRTGEKSLSGILTATILILPLFFVFSH